MPTVENGGRALDSFDIAWSDTGLDSGKIDGDFDSKTWKAMQQKLISAPFAGNQSPAINTDTLIQELSKASQEVQKFSAARDAFTTQQTVANIFMQSDNFVKDSIAGK